MALLGAHQAFTWPTGLGVSSRNLPMSEMFDAVTVSSLALHGRSSLSPAVSDRIYHNVGHDSLKRLRGFP